MAPRFEGEGRKEDGFVDGCLESRLFLYDFWMLLGMMILTFSPKDVFFSSFSSVEDMIFYLKDDFSCDSSRKTWKVHQLVLPRNLRSSVKIFFAFHMS